MGTVEMVTTATTENNGEHRNARKLTVGNSVLPPPQLYGLSGMKNSPAVDAVLKELAPLIARCAEPLDAQ